jgi:hypothetical protein
VVRHRWLNPLNSSLDISTGQGQIQIIHDGPGAAITRRG